jgi:hypothetical protein
MDDPQLDGGGPTDHKEVWIGNVLYTEDRSGLHRIDPHPEEFDPEEGGSDAGAGRRGWRGLFGIRRRILPR